MINENIKTIYTDFDGTVVNTIAAIVDCYNEDFNYYDKYKYILPEQIQTWNFEECNCASEKYIDTYFNQKRFFDKLKFMPNAFDMLRRLVMLGYNVVIVSMGNTPNLKGKDIWIKENLPFCNFIGVDLSKYNNKNHIDMSDGILVDDCATNLITSNAIKNVCYGDYYPWNKDWHKERISNWYELLYLL